MFTPMRSCASGVAKLILDFLHFSFDIIILCSLCERVLRGIPYAMPGEEYIARVELAYRTGRFEEILLPYYRFYVLLPEIEDNNGLKTYGVYYVPAITDEYIANMPVYDGRFN